MAGAAIGGGRTTSDSGLKIHVNVADSVTAQQLEDDWVLVHEMVHLALPELGRSHNWLAEGLAVYVEGVARAQAGNREVGDVWAEDRHSMPMGLPREGEGGMDQTSTWARTYWGGALFCLQGDVAIRQQTGNRVGLRERAGGLSSIRPADTGSTGNIDEVLRIGDAATGTRALEDLYRQVRSSPQAPDLDRLWDALGVPRDPRTQPFDDHAPLAAIRVAITAPAAKS